MDIKMYEFTQETLGNQMNLCKSLILDQLVKDEKLTEKEAIEYERNFFFVVKKPSAISEWWMKLMAKHDKVMLILCEQKNLKPDEEEKSE